MITLSKEASKRIPRLLFLLVCLLLNGFYIFIDLQGAKPTFNNDRPISLMLDGIGVALVLAAAAAVARRVAWTGMPSPPSAVTRCFCMLH